MKLIYRATLLLMLSGIAAYAQASSSPARAETAVSIMLKALGSQSQRMLASVTAPGAVYFSNLDAEKERRSTALSLDSMSEIRGRCVVEMVYALCTADTVMVVWNCPSQRTSLKQTYSQVDFNEHERITSVIGDAEPLICVTGPGPKRPGSN